MTRAVLLATAAIGAAAFSIDVANAQGPMDWTGFYAGVHGGFINGQVTINGGETWGDVSGFVGGVLAGRNFARKPGSPFQWGVEGDFGWINASNSNNGISMVPLLTETLIDDCYNYFSYDLNWDGHLRARVGLPSGNLMPFVAAGLAFADLSVRKGCERYEQEGGVFVGGTVGAGLDFKLSPTLIGRAEFLYDFFGTKEYDCFSASLNGWTLRAALTWMLH